MEKNTKNTIYIELRESKVPQPNGVIVNADNKKILSLGENNLYPYFLNYLYSKSAIHRAFINGKVLYFKNFLPNFDEITAKNGSSKYTLPELNMLLLNDFEQKNAFAVKVINSKLLKTRYFDYVDIDTVRISSDGNAVYISKNWDKGKKAEIKEYPNFFDDNNAPESIAIYYAETKSYFDPNQNKFIYNYYPEPTYNGAIDSILTDIEICHFNYSEIINGFAGGTLINLNNGIPETATEQESIKRNIRQAITDRDKKGGVVVTFSNGKDTSPEVTPLNGNNLVERYSQLTDEVMQRILVAHNIPSGMLVGIKTEGQLGGSTELDMAKTIFEEKYIKPRLETFFEFMNQILLTPVNLTFNNKEEEHKHEFDEEMFFSSLEKIGTPKEGIVLLKDFQEFDLPEKKLLSKYQQYDLKLTSLQDKVLSLIINGNDLSSISKSLKVDIATVTDAYNELQAMKLINENNSVTKAGKAAANQTEILQVYYEYKVRPGLGEPLIETSRPFCKKLINANKVYTREELATITNTFGQDVWFYRGGWFHDKRDDKNYPFCRHYWYQVLGLKKK